MLPVCLVLISTSCLVPVHCVQPCVSIYLGPLCPWALLCQITVYHMFHLLLHSWQLSFLYFMLQTAQGSVVHFPWLAHQFQTVSLPAFARVSKVSCLFLTPEPLTLISHFNFSIYWVCFFYPFSLISVFISRQWGTPYSINGINWKNPTSSCLWCTDCIVRRISKASKWRSKVTPGNFLLLGELKVTAPVEQLLYEASNSLYVTRVIFFRAFLLMQLQMYI